MGLYVSELNICRGRGRVRNCCIASKLRAAVFCGSDTTEHCSDSSSFYFNDFFFVFSVYGDANLLFLYLTFTFSFQKTADVES